MNEEKEPESCVEEVDDHEHVDGTWLFWWTVGGGKSIVLGVLSFCVIAYFLLLLVRS